VNKVIALICVISWSGFWAFGYLALSASSANVTEMEVAAILAAIGFLTGTFAYMALSRRVH
jgi:predicted RND superfamily exporter protein